MKGTAIAYSSLELSWIEKRATNLRSKTHSEFCTKFDRQDVSLKNFNSLCKRKGWLTGRTGRYEKGTTPHNQGKKMPFNANSASIQFKKGNRPHNTKHLGHERITKDGYVEISVSEPNPYTGYERRYVLKHRYLWEQTNGALDDGMCLKCIDGNRINTEPENWEPMPRASLPYLNGHRGLNYAAAETEVRPAILTLAKLRHLNRKASLKVSQPES